MTAKKDLKRRVRERQAKTGESYTSALAHIRSKATRTNVELPECHDVTPWAELAGLHCKAVVSDELWRAEGSLGAPGERFRAVFERLRALLLAMQGEPSGAELGAVILRGERGKGGIPNAMHEVMESRRFMEQVRSGVRGVSQNGRLVAFDVPRGEAQVTLVGVFILSPVPAEERRSVLWLSSLARQGSELSLGMGALLVRELALAGFGGLRGDE